MCVSTVYSVPSRALLKNKNHRHITQMGFEPTTFAPYVRTPYVCTQLKICIHVYYPVQCVSIMHITQTALQIFLHQYECNVHICGYSNNYIQDLKSQYLSHSKQCLPLCFVKLHKSYGAMILFNVNFARKPPHPNSLKYKLIQINHH